MPPYLLVCHRDGGLQIDDFNCISVLGRGHFGKVCVYSRLFLACIVSVSVPTTTISLSFTHMQPSSIQSHPHFFPHFLSWTVGNCF